MDSPRRRERVKTCQRCGREYQGGGNKFCHLCGEEFVGTCAKCGKEFPNPYGVRKKCLECHKRKKKPTFTEGKACAVCGKGFIPRSASHAYCSEGCFAMRFGKAVCPQCGKGFVRAREGQIHCTSKCAMEAKHEASKRPCLVCGKTLSHRDDRKNKYCSKECADRARAMRAKMVVCPVCGKEFKGRMRKGQMQKYCSPECQRKGQRKREDKICQTCGRTFHPHSMSKGLFCSRECSGVSLRAKSCPICGKWVPSGKTYCSEKCAATMHAGLTYEAEFDSILKAYDSVSEDIAQREFLTRICEVCGAGFVASVHNQVCCSDACSRRRDNMRSEKRIYRNGIPDLSVTLTRLFVRDGGRCRGCGMLMTLEGEGNEDDYPSIDHIVPLARGGLHTWDNVQLLCRRCNWEKGDSLMGKRASAEGAWFRVGWMNYSAIGQNPPH